MMGYFSATVRPRPLEAPQGVRLWREPAGWRLSWSLPPVDVTSVRLTREEQSSPQVIAEVLAQRRWFPLPDNIGAAIGVAWQRGAETGAVTVVHLPVTVQSRFQCHYAPSDAQAPLSTAQVLSEIDKALSENKAKTGLFGLFDL